MIIMQLERYGEIKDLGLGVISDSSLTFEDYVTGEVNKAYDVFGIIKRNFEHI